MMVVFHTVSICSHCLDSVSLRRFPPETVLVRDQTWAASEADMSNGSERSLRASKRTAQASKALCSIGQNTLEAYRRAAIEWGTAIGQGASNQTIKQFASEHFRALSEF